VTFCPKKGYSKLGRIMRKEKGITMKVKNNKFLSVVLCAVFFVGSLISMNKEDMITMIKNHIESGRIAYKLTVPEEIKAVLGEPLKQEEGKDGGMQMLKFEYPDVEFFFWKMRNDPAPFTLRSLLYQKKRIDIGENEKLVLRTKEDLKKIDKFWGLADISLVRLDLKDQTEILVSMTFDTLTQWPSEEKLPRGFQPGELLENAKNPGLGILALHEKGIDGRGIGIAIIDQPLLLGHKEYTESITRYDETGLKDLSPQMHGSPVTSIAVGKNLGVAPGASLTYFAVPMWESDNMPYISAFEKILEWNAKLPDEEKIRVVSISTGMFPHYPHYKEWKEKLTHMEEQGILIVTCDPSMLDYGILSLKPGKDPDEFENYEPGYYVSEGDVIRVPGSNKTVASHRGNDVYTFDRMGGMSWGAPYIAGLTALAFQVNPGIKPREILQVLVQTAESTDAGPVVNPEKFIETIRTK